LTLPLRCERGGEGRKGGKDGRGGDYMVVGRQRGRKQPQFDENNSSCCVSVERMIMQRRCSIDPVIKKWTSTFLPAPKSTRGTAPNCGQHVTWRPPVHKPIDLAGSLRLIALFVSLFRFFQKSTQTLPLPKSTRNANDVTQRNVTGRRRRRFVALGKHCLNGQNR